MATPNNGFSNVNGVGVLSSVGSSLLFGSTSVPSVDVSLTGVPLGLFAVPTAILSKLLTFEPVKSTLTINSNVSLAPTAKVPELKRFVSPTPLKPAFTVKPPVAVKLAA